MTTNNNSQTEPENDSLSTSIPESSPTTSRQDASSPSSNKDKKAIRLGAVAIALSLVLSGSLALYSQYQQRQYQAELTQLQTQLLSTQQQLQQQMAQNKEHLDSTAKTISSQTETQLGQQQKSIESLQLAIADVKGRRPNDWLLAEADYLVKMAGRKLYLEHDPETATQLMESADQRIAALNDPSLTTLRQAMSSDITALKSIPLIDRDGLVLRLVSLEQQIDQLPLANAILPEAQQETHEVVSQDINDWRHNLITSLKDFASNFITFRSRDGNVIPLLSPKQDFYLRENLKAKLETAIRAVYDRQPEVFTSSLTTAETWSGSFFNPDDKGVKSFQNTIAELAKQQIKVTYPVKLVSQEPLSDLIRERLRREVTSMTGEEN
ncbi:uroporphyrinogen-III C-methyltransferase [Vibrio tritonius]|uniref:Uroporphyrinogen-III C-methyltransferase n=1 Tax=Vibrio tritonius TaxID=1435069 RepID=A0ABS7YID0_9VIBR|nr:uroporphyrinogen-III C-methyltransferase [Vibrio tritonius]MCA2015431.1 uroporphyrinogen-III C-methyltransferase [Vibrio tritonius]